MAPSTGETRLETARRVIDANDYLTLATADPGGRPWATPVWFAERDLREFFWISRPETRHSRNVAGQPDVALVIFDSTTPVGDARAVYVEAIAGEVTDAELGDRLAVYSARSVARGIRPWTESEVTGAAPFRLFRATATSVFVLDENERRVRVG